MAFHVYPCCACWPLEGCVKAGDCISVIWGQECAYLHAEVQGFRFYELVVWEQEQHEEA